MPVSKSPDIYKGGYKTTGKYGRKRDVKKEICKK